MLIAFGNEHLKSRSQLPTTSTEDSQAGNKKGEKKTEDSLTKVANKEYYVMLAEYHIVHCQPTGAVQITVSQHKYKYKNEYKYKYRHEYKYKYKYKHYK